MKDMHIGKEIIDCNYKIHRNLCSNMPTFGSAFLLMIDLKMHNAKNIMGSNHVFLY